MKNIIGVMEVIQNRNEHGRDTFNPKIKKTHRCHKPAESFWIFYTRKQCFLEVYALWKGVLCIPLSMEYGYCSELKVGLF